MYLMKHYTIDYENPYAYAKNKSSDLKNSYSFKDIRIKSNLVKIKNYKKYTFNIYKDRDYSYTEDKIYDIYSEYNDTFIGIVSISLDKIYNIVQIKDAYIDIKHRRSGIYSHIISNIRNKYNVCSDYKQTDSARKFWVKHEAAEYYYRNNNVYLLIKQ